MIPLNDLLIFALAALVLVLTPGPNMMYCVSRSICQGRAAGMISLLGVATGFVVHMLAATFGLTAFHVNRMLQKMRRERLIRYQRGTVEVPDWCRLAALAEFDAEHITDRWRAALRALDEATDYPVEAECAWLNGPRSALRHDEHRARSSSIDDDAKGIFAMGLFTRDIEARRRRPPSRGDRYVGPA